LAAEHRVSLSRPAAPSCLIGKIVLRGYGMDKQSGVSITGEGIISDGHLLHGRSAVLLARRHKRFIQLKISPVTNIDVINNEANYLIDEWETSFPNRCMEMRKEILNKVEDARAVIASAVVEPRYKNPGGSPSKFSWDDVWIEMVRYALEEGMLPEDRLKFRRYLEEWCEKNWSNIPTHLDEEIKKRVDKLYNTPGIVERG
jgi:hypothetical protein